MSDDTKKSFADMEYTGRHTNPRTDKQKLEDLLTSFGVEFDVDDNYDGSSSIGIKGTTFYFTRKGNDLDRVEAD